MNYLINLLPAWLQAIIRPELPHLISSFQKLETKLSTVAGRKQAAHDALVALRAEIDSEIADTKGDIARAKRIAARVSELVA